MFKYEFMENKLQSVIIVELTVDNLFKGYKVTEKNTWSDLIISPDRMEKSDFVYAKITGTDESRLSSKTGTMKEIKF